MTEKVEVEEKGLTAKALIVGIMLTVISTIYYTAAFITAPPSAGGNAGYNIITAYNLSDSSSGGFVAVWGLTFGTFFALGAIFMLLRRVGLRFSSKELAVIFAMQMMPMIGVSVYLEPTTLTTLATYYVKTTPAFNAGWDVLKPYWVPNLPMDSAYNQISILREPINWAAWTPVILNSIAYWLMLSLLFFFSGVLFKPAFIDSERLLYPNATIMNEIIVSSTQPDYQKSLFKSKWFKIGLFVGFVLNIGNIIILVQETMRAGIRGFNPVIPYNSFRGLWGVDLWNYIGYIFPFGMLAFTWNPWFLGYAFILPMELLWSFLIAYIALDLVWPAAMAWSGKASLWVPGTGRVNTSFWRSWNFSSGAGGGWIGGWSTVSQGSMIFAGALTGMAAYTLWTNRKALRNSLKEKPYQICLVAAVVLSVLYGIVYPLFFGAVWWLVMVTLVGLWFLSIGGARLFAETGAFGGMMETGTQQAKLNNFLGPIVLDINPDLPQYQGLPVEAWTYSTINIAPGSASTYAGAQADRNAMFSSLEIQKMGSLNKMHMTEMIIAGVTATVIYFVIQEPMMLFFQNLGGQSFMANGQLRAHLWDYHQSIFRYEYSSWGTNVNTWPWRMEIYVPFAVGTVVLYYLRRRLRWFKFNPVAIALAVLSRGPAQLFLGAAIIGIAIKTVVLRVYGAKRFDEIIPPLGIALIIVTSLVLAASFFYVIVWWVARPGMIQV